MLMDLRKVHRSKSCQRIKHSTDRLNASLATNKVDIKLKLLFLFYLQAQIVNKYFIILVQWTHFSVSDEHGFTSKHLYRVICLIKYYQEAPRDRQQKRTYGVIHACDCLLNTHVMWSRESLRLWSGNKQ